MLFRLARVRPLVPALYAPANPPPRARYCSQVWMRGNTQLRVWEMQEMDDEARAFVDRILGPGKAHLSDGGSATHDADDDDDKAGSQQSLGRYSGKGGIAAIAPFTIEPLTANGCPSLANDKAPSYRFATISTPFHRPPVFGPETVVLDPRIKAVHRQVMIDTCRFGLWFMLVSRSCICAVPSCCFSGSPLHSCRLSLPSFSLSPVDRIPDCHDTTVVHSLSLFTVIYLDPARFCLLVLDIYAWV